MAGIGGYQSNKGPQKDDRTWSSLPGRLKSLLTGDQGKESSPEVGPGHGGTEHGVLIQTQPIGIDKDWQKVEHPKVNISNNLHPSTIIIIALLSYRHILLVIRMFSGRHISGDIAARSCRQLTENC